ncbi:hypothetical protein [Ensifer sp. B1-9]|uniref:hypothetical protein n=1 Tax=Ensifer sp. B1-9 TaxID=3141455 RepID=UPI003D2468EE
MQKIVIEVARYNEQKSEFVISNWHHFPCNAKGLALAIIAADRMMQIDAHHTAFADIAIKFEGGFVPELEYLDAGKMFELIGRHKAGFPIIKDCLEIIVELSEEAARLAA